MRLYARTHAKSGAGNTIIPGHCDDDRMATHGPNMDGQ